MVAVGCKKMCVAKSRSQHIAKLPDRFFHFKILNDVARLETRLKHKTVAFFGLDLTHRNLLQASLRAFIIAQYQFDKRAFGEALFSFADKLFDIRVHFSERLTHMETARSKDNSSTIGQKQFVEAVAYLLRETFEGSPEGQPSAYLDRGVGVFITLDALSAEAASKEFHGTTAATQTEHAKFYLDRLCEYINDRTEAVNWEDSWLIETVNDAEWDALRSSVRRSYEDTLRCLAEDRDWTEMKIAMAMGLIAHSAYHLGAIRQIMKGV